MLERYRQRNPGASIPAIIFYECVRTSAMLLLVLLYRARTFHRERVPATGPVLIAANHQSFLDPPLVGGMAIQRQTSFVARAGLFKFKPFAKLISALNSVPMNDEEGDLGAIKIILKRLAGGHSVVIFPEGSRTDTGAMQPFKRGVALLVKRAKCPVVPAAVEGCFDAWPNFRPLPKLFGQRIAVMYGQPIPYDELMKDGAEAALARLAREIEAMRMELRAWLREETGGSFPKAGLGDMAAV